MSDLTAKAFPGPDRQRGNQPVRSSVIVPCDRPATRFRIGAGYATMAVGKPQTGDDRVAAMIEILLIVVSIVVVGSLMVVWATWPEE